MVALFIYLALALGVSFICSIAEAVLLSVTTAYISVLEQEGRPVAAKLQRLKTDIDSPLAAILSLNTIAHTVGAAGVGAQATALFGNQWLGLISAVLTFLILVFSEIIPKTLGSVYWRKLAPLVAHMLVYMIRGLYPLVWLSLRLTRRLVQEPMLEGFSRDEFAAMAGLGMAEGQLTEQEANILTNLFKLQDTRVEEVMTPSTVMFTLPADNSVSLFFNKHLDTGFSRIPIYQEHQDNIIGFVLRNDLLTAYARGNTETQLANYRRTMVAVLDKLSLLSAFEQIIQQGCHIMYVVDEYGTVKGLITLEDILETLVGMEIVDESDRIDDMRKLARRHWLRRAKRLGINISTD